MRWTSATASTVPSDREDGITDRMGRSAGGMLGGRVEDVGAILCLVGDPSAYMRSYQTAGVFAFCIVGWTGVDEVNAVPFARGFGLFLSGGHRSLSLGLIPDHRRRVRGVQGETRFGMLQGGCR